MARRTKRLIDVVAALAGLVLLSPLLTVVALTIRLRMGRPIFFRQFRPGYQARPFVLVKFRTMREEVDQDGVPVPDDQRVPKLGAFLRRTSIDELPQFWNILKGDMSFVGPRPLSMEYLPRYSTEQARRHNVMPGLTGWAQVNGRHMLSWEERFALDTWYVDNWSLRLDMRILRATVRKVFSGAGEAPPATADFGSAESDNVQARSMQSGSEASPPSRP